MTDGSVHVWTIQLDVDQAALSSLLDVLSGDERVRAARLRTTELRLRYVAAHGAARIILARYTGMPAGTIPLDATAAGKPFVRGNGVAFNLSRSEDLAVCAVAPAGRLGVDVERLKPVPDADEIVRRYFAPGEVQAWAALPAAERPAAFLSAWTRKEAVIKAIGDEEQCPSRSFEVDIRVPVPEPSIAVDPSLGPWYLRAFDPAPGFVAAVAHDRPIREFERRAFDVHARDGPST